MSKLSKEIIIDKEEFKDRFEPRDKFKSISKELKRSNNTHYLKWNFQNDEYLSIRYFYNFQNKSEYNHKFVIKSHDQKLYSVVSDDIAAQIIESQKTAQQEIIGFKDIVNNKYIKSLITYTKKGKRKMITIIEECGD